MSKNDTNAYWPSLPLSEDLAWGCVWIIELGKSVGYFYGGLSLPANQT